MKRLTLIANLVGRAEKPCHRGLLCLFASIILLLMSCSVIDDDLSDCYEEVPQAQVDYELKLVTNLTTELTTQLTTQTDIQLASALKMHLNDIFTDYAHDVDLSFYDTQGDSILLQKDEHIMDANQASYSLNLPMRQYMHLAAANVVDNEIVDVMYDNRCHRSMIDQIIRDTIDSHTTGIFTARQPMEVLGNVSQNFDVHLYMANCAAALVIDPKNYGSIDEVRVYSTGFATGFSICDSVYHYDRQPPIVRTSVVNLGGVGEQAFCSVTFPSPEPSRAATRTIIETEEPFIAEPSDEVLWEFRVYVPIKGNTRGEESITETILPLKVPLRAGEFKIIKCRIGDQGEIVPDNSEITTSVTLHWQPGLVIDT